MSLEKEEEFDIKEIYTPLSAAADQGRSLVAVE